MEPQTSKKTPVRVQYHEVPFTRKSARDRNWLPFGLRLPFLTSVVLMLGICIFALELLIRRSEPFTPPVFENLRKRGLASEPTPATKSITMSTHLDLATTCTHKHKQRIRASRSKNALPYVTKPSTHLRVQRAPQASETTPVSPAVTTAAVPESPAPAATTPVATTAAATTPPVTSPTVAHTFTGNYLDITSTTPQVAASPEPKPETTPAPKAPEPTPQSDPQPPTTPAAPDSEETTRKSYFPAGGLLTITSTTAAAMAPQPDPQPENETSPAARLPGPTSPTTTPVTTDTRVYFTTSGYLKITSTTTTQATPTGPATLTQTSSGYLRITSTTPGSDQTTGSDETTYYDSETSGYLRIASTTVSPQAEAEATPEVTPEVTTNKDGNLMVGDSTIPAAATTNKDGYLEVDGSTVQAPVTTNTEGYIMIGGSTVRPAATTNADGYLMIGGTTVATTNSEGYLVVGGATVPATATTNKEGLIIWTSAGQTMTVTTDQIITPTAGLKAPTGDKKATSHEVVSIPPTTIVDVYSRTTVFTSNGQVITSVIVSSSTRVASLSTKVVTLASKTQTSTMATPTLITGIQKLMQPDLKVKGVFNEYWYFAAMFVPSIIAVILREMWSIIAAGLKLTEPFYQMNQADGSSARESLMADYLGSLTSWYTIGSALRGSLPMITVLIIHPLMSLLAPLAAESMQVATLDKHRNDEGVLERMNPAWVLSARLVRVLQGSLSVVVIVIVVIAVRGRRRRSGLAANPSRTATMAALLSHPSVAQDLHFIHPDATEKGIGQALAQNHYTITDLPDGHGGYRCGLVRIGEHVAQGLQRLPMEDNTGPMTGLLPSDKPGRHRSVRSLRQNSLDALFLILAVGLLGTIIGYRLDGSSSGFNNFFNSGTFGPKFLLSLGASYVTLTFEDLEREVRLLIPYRRLAERQAPARDTVLRSVNGTALSSLARSLRHGSWFHLFVALTALLGNVLIIAVTGIPFKDSLTWVAYQTCTYMSMGILVLMLAAAVSIFIWRRKNKQLGIPLDPSETLIRSWMSLSNPSNQLRALLDDAGDRSAGALKIRLRNDGGRYYAAWVRDQYGRQMWCVDREVEHHNGGYRYDDTIQRQV